MLKQESFKKVLVLTILISIIEFMLLVLYTPLLSYLSIEIITRITISFIAFVANTMFIGSYIKACCQKDTNKYELSLLNTLIFVPFLTFISVIALPLMSLKIIATILYVCFITLTLIIATTHYRNKQLESI